MRASWAEVPRVRLRPGPAGGRLQLQEQLTAVWRPMGTRSAGHGRGGIRPNLRHDHEVRPISQAALHRSRKRFGLQAVSV